MLFLEKAGIILCVLQISNFQILLSDYWTVLSWVLLELYLHFKEEGINFFQFQGRHLPLRYSRSNQGSISFSEAEDQELCNTGHFYRPCQRTEVFPRGFN